jgi:hypothetical protein
MLTATAVSESITTPLVDTPSDVSVIYAYAPAEHKIHVPVYVREGAPFAPPFLIPRGTWTVVYEVKTPGWVFDNVTYHGYDCTPPDVCPLPPGVVDPPDNLNEPGGTTLRTRFDTNGVLDVNMMGCTIFLRPDSDRPDSEPLGSDGVISGDPTIAVVKEPMDG